MNEAVFEKLVTTLMPRLTKSSQREPISPRERLSITLRFLATGDSFQTIAWSYRVGVSTVHSTVFETCEAILHFLSGTELKLPTTEKWSEIAKDFYDLWNFPNVVGCIDGKHILVQQPANSGSEYYNYKGTNSIVLLAVADALLRFTIVDIGRNGRMSDGGVFSRSALFEALEAGTLGIPGPAAIPGTEIVTPRVFLTDDAFPLRPDMMKPFKETVTDDQRIFNYRLSRARRIVESTFGVMASKWRLFRRPITALSPHRAEAFVKAAVCLHNYLRNIDIEIGRNYYANDSFVSSNSAEPPLDNVTGMVGLSHQGSNNYSASAKDLRDLFMRYFVSGEGSSQTPWQYTLVRRGRDDE
jgi:hypothetical protein